jgi:hypothetical protein
LRRYSKNRLVSEAFAWVNAQCGRSACDLEQDLALQGAALRAQLSFYERQFAVNVQS